MKPPAKIGAMLLLAGSSVISLTLLKQRQADDAAHSGTQQSTPFPFFFVRERLQDVRASDVSRLNLAGVHMGGWAEESVVISDSLLIKVFVEALQNATTNSRIGIGNGADTIEIHFKPRNGQARPSEHFVFNPETSGLWYGEEFKSALKKLSQFQAVQAKQKARTLSEQQVLAARLGSVRVDDSSQIKLLLNALQAVDERAFAYASPPRGANFETLRLSLRSGKTMNFRFVLAPEAPSVEMEPLWKLYQQQPNPRL